MNLLRDMVDHAKRVAPNEACGLVVSSALTMRLIEAKNLSETPQSTFQIDEEAWLEVRDDEDVVGIYHSHPQGSPRPTMADLAMCELTGVPWHIVDLIGGYTCTSPTGFVAPYLKRPYVHGVHDCYAIVRDWYNREWNLGLPDFERENEWWARGGNLYLDHYRSCGFVEIERQEPMVGDAYLFAVMSKVPNHAAIYVGGGEILHHVRNRYSTQELYGGMWQRLTTHQLRHTSRMNGNG